MARHRILAVDDDSKMTHLIRRNLESEEVEVIEVHTGHDCLRIAGEEKIDLILLDLMLPDCSGWDVLRSLRSGEMMQGIPVFIVSVQRPDPELMHRLRPEDYIQKPFDARDLAERVSRFTVKDKHL